jgi:hypothetical protein
MFCHLAMENGFEPVHPTDGSQIRIKQGPTAVTVIGVAANGRGFAYCHFPLFDIAQIGQSGVGYTTLDSPVIPDTEIFLACRAFYFFTRLKVFYEIQIHYLRLT